MKKKSVLGFYFRIKLISNKFNSLQFFTNYHNLQILLFAKFYIFNDEFKIAHNRNLFDKWKYVKILWLHQAYFIKFEIITLLNLYLHCFNHRHANKERNLILFILLIFFFPRRYIRCFIFALENSKNKNYIVRIMKKNIKIFMKM